VLQRKLTAEKLSHSIRQAITDTSMRQQAERLGQQIRSEDGVANAVRFVEQWVR
jgi:sterol 3beta-glucosyltransferase